MIRDLGSPSASAAAWASILNQIFAFFDCARTRRRNPARPSSNSARISADGRVGWNLYSV